MATDDFFDFMTTGGDELINGRKCGSCGKWVNAEDIDVKNECSHCGQSLD